MISPPSALASAPWQAAGLPPSRYEVEPGRNVVPKTCEFAGGARDAGTLNVVGAACGEYGVPR